MTQEAKYLPLSVDFLGILRTLLGDLVGIDALAYELIQNADDVKDANGQPGAITIEFNVCDDALYVSNDGVFREVDFRRMQSIAHGDKATEEGTTGTFGIGFTAVYQITDRPELLSSNQHWVIDPAQSDPQKRIAVQGAETKGTTFKLPWAFTEESLMRQKLNRPAILIDDLDGYSQQISEAITKAALFLKQIERLVVKRNGKVLTDIKRIVSGKVCEIFKNDSLLARYRLFNTSFDLEAGELKARYSNVEHKRRSNVIVALDITEEKIDGNGWFYAVLPTQKSTGLPFSINADFYTIASRKDIKLEDDYSSNWNKAALKAAAKVIAESWLELRNELKPALLWKIIQSVYDLCIFASTHESGIFWEVSSPAIRKLPLVFTTAEQWHVPESVRISPEKASAEMIEILEELDIPVVHEDLRKHRKVLDALGASDLLISNVLSALKQINPQGDKKISDYPSSLRSSNGWLVLDHLLSLLDGTNASNKNLFATIAFVPCADDIVRRPGDVFSNLDNTRRVFPSYHWIHSSLRETTVIHEACRTFTLRDATNSLEQSTKDGTLNDDFEPFYNWLLERTGRLSNDHESRERLRRLPIWPVNHGFGTLVDASLPGNFTDVLQIANVVDTSKTRGRIDLFKELDVQPLNLHEYLQNHVARALANNSLSLSQRRALATLLCNKLAELQQDASIKDLLARLSIVECAGGKFVKASDAYLPSELLRVLKIQDREALIPPGSAGDLLRKLYDWLGTPQLPTPEKIVAGIQEICKKPPDDTNVSQIREVVRLLAKQFLAIEQNFNHLHASPNAKDKMRQATVSGFAADYARLKIMQWLPARRYSGRLQSWQVPAHLYNIFRSYLFESQGVFIDLPYELQQDGSKFLEFLGVKSDPQVSMVVEHLKTCANTGSPVNTAVYEFLNNKIDEQAEVIKSLAETNCIFVNEKKWIKPAQAYWKPHGLGKARYQLDKSFEKYSRLFKCLGVKDEPDPLDFVKVLRELSSDYERDHHRLGDDEMALVQVCWESLSQTLLDDPSAQMMIHKEIKSLTNAKVVQDSRKMLVRPNQILFADRNELVAKFGDLGKSVTIPFRQLSMKALQIAGVKRFSHAISLRILENAPATGKDFAAAEHFELVKPLLQRVVRASKIDLDDVNQSVLPKITFIPTARLLVQYELALPWLNRRELSEPEFGRAVFDTNNNNLYVTVLPQVHWTIVAREIAHAVLSSGEIGLLASPFTNILMSQSFEEAANLLDEFGFSRIEEPSQQVSLASNSATLIGTEIDLESADHARHPIQISLTPALTDENHHDESDEPEENEKPAENIKREMTLAAETNHADYATVQPSNAEDARRKPRKDADAFHNENHSHQPDRDGVGRATSGSTSSSSRQERLRSYVVSKSDKSAVDLSTHSDEVQALINQIDQAGMSQVMRFEANHNRQARQMSHDHEGYDIESTGKDGIRYIEVKSIGSEWDKGRPASLTPAQLVAAKRLQDNYWLYVVEYALETCKAQIHVIRNPYERISQFLFDDGWRAAADTYFVAQHSSE